MYQPIIINYTQNVHIIWWRIKSKRCFCRYIQTFDIVWHEVLIFKLKQNGISGDLLQILSDFLSHLREHEFKHSFHDTINPLCGCGVDTESTEHFLLHCSQFVNERRTLLSTIGNINYKLLENTDSSLTQTLLFGNTSFVITDNTKILNATINLILLTKRFDEPLF